MLIYCQNDTINVIIMFQEAKETLKKLGLKENEIKVYLACLENKQGLFVADIVKTTNQKRSTVNLILNRLITKGFITSITKGNRKCYLAEQLEVVLFNFEESLQSLRSIIPLLKSVTKDSQGTKVRFFEGKAGLEKIFLDILLTMKMTKNKDKEILAISSGKDIFKVLPDHEKKFMQKRIKERIQIKWIAPESEVSRKFQKKDQRDYREMKFFDNKKYPFHVEIDIYDNKIALLNLDQEPTGTIIEDIKLSESFRSLFNLLWSNISKK